MHWIMQQHNILMLVSAQSWASLQVNLEYREITALLLALPLTHYLPSGKSLNMSVLQLPQQSHADRHSFYKDFGNTDIINFRNRYVTTLR